MAKSIPKKTIINANLIKKIKTNSNAEIANIIRSGIDEIEKILTQIEKSNDSSLKNYSIIRMSTILESVMKKVIVILIDTFDFNYPIEITLDVTQLKSLRKSQKITTGEIVANSFNYHDLNVHYKIMDSLFVNRFWKKMCEIDKDIFELNKNLKFMIEERHSIVHELNNTKKGPGQVRDLLNQLMRYLDTYLSAVKILRDEYIKNRNKK